MITITSITFLVLAIGQIILAGLLRGKFSRLGVWLMLLGSILLMHWVSLGESGFMRMIWICSVLMASMKAITYREWSATRNRKLTWSRWLMFSCLWFGMDPAAFVTRRKVEWKSHAVVGGLVPYVWISQLMDLLSVRC